MSRIALVFQYLGFEYLQIDIYDTDISFSSLSDIFHSVGRACHERWPHGAFSNCGVLDEFFLATRAMICMYSETCL